jgi:hypothetical protein
MVCVELEKNKKSHLLCFLEGCENKIEHVLEVPKKHPDEIGQVSQVVHYTSLCGLHTKIFKASPEMFLKAIAEKKLLIYTH